MSEPPFRPLLNIIHKLLVLLQLLIAMPLFFVMAILPVYTTSKLHGARINLRQTPSSTPGLLFNYSPSQLGTRSAHAKSGDKVYLF